MTTAKALGGLKEWTWGALERPGLCRVKREMRVGFKKEMEKIEWKWLP